MAPKVVVFGTSGYAAVHLRHARALHDTAEILFAGACDVREPSPEAKDVLPPGAVLTQDAQELLQLTAPDIAVVATPPHTHLQVALTAIAAGCHVLVEKPPVLDLESFDQLATAAQRAGVQCQVGFQSFGSVALPALRAAIDTGAIGKLTGVGTAGAWVRRDAYYTRNPWAGQRALAGDGSLTNPFAHAVATAILITGKATELPEQIEVELHRARPIAADDTACARIVLPTGLKVVAAATLCTPREVDPYVVLHGTRGKARWWYRSNVLEINGERVPVSQPIDLLRNLARHVRDNAPLVAPLSQTRAFTAFVQAVRDHPGPRRIPAEWVDRADDRYLVHSVDKVVESAAETMSLFSELGVPWAT
jgi:predicted dehydrogenase